MLSPGRPATRRKPRLVNDFRFASTRIVARETAFFMAMGWMLPSARGFRRIAGGGTIAGDAARWLGTYLWVRPGHGRCLCTVAES